MLLQTTAVLVYYWSYWGGNVCIPAARLFTGYIPLCGKFTGWLHLGRCSSSTSITKTASPSQAFRNLWQQLSNDEKGVGNLLASAFCQCKQSLSYSRVCSPILRDDPYAHLLGWYGLPSHFLSWLLGSMNFPIRFALA